MKTPAITPPNILLNYVVGTVWQSLPDPGGQVQQILFMQHVKACSAEEAYAAALPLDEEELVKQGRVNHRKVMQNCAWILLN